MHALPCYVSHHVRLKGPVTLIFFFCLSSATKYLEDPEATAETVAVSALMVQVSLRSASESFRGLDVSLVSSCSCNTCSTVVLFLRISKVPCSRTTRSTGTGCCRLRETPESFYSTHTHDSAGMFSSTEGSDKKI